MRDLAIAIRASPQRLAVFKQTLLNLKLSYHDKDYLGEETDEINIEVDEHVRILLPLRDVATRWSSTYLMLRRALAIRSGLDETTTHRDFISQDIGEEGWKKIEECLKFLEPFATITKHVEGFKHPTLSCVIPLYNKLLNFLEDWANDSSHSSTSKSAAFAAISKLTKYYDKTTEVYLVSTVLDPRLKLNYFIKNGWEDGDLAYGGGNLIEKSVRPA